MTTPNMPMRARYRRSYGRGLHLDFLLTVIALVLDLVFLQSRALADLPEGKLENPNVVAGRGAIGAKDFKSALELLEKAVQDIPGDADAHTLLGYTYRKLGAFHKSMEHYQKALKIDSNHRSTHEYLGELYLDMNQPLNAEKQLHALKKACPFFGKCAEYNDLREAIDRYKRKNSRSPA